MDITFEMNLNQLVISREGYTVLDWISDVGGIQGILISVMAVLISFWNYNQFENHMVSRLYRLQDAEMQVLMSPRPLSNPRDFVYKHLICCKRGKRSRLERAFEKAREELQNETNIIQIIKSRRFFEAALARLLTLEEITRLKKLSYFITVDPDQSDDYQQQDHSCKSKVDEVQTFQHSNEISKQLKQDK